MEGGVIKTNIAGINVVILGAWNESLLNPDWLKKNIDSLANESDEPVLEVRIFPMTHRITFGNFIVKPTNNSLIIEPTTTDISVIEKLGSIAEEIYHKLEHTPVKALGFNFAATLESDEKFVSDKICPDEAINAALVDDLPDFVGDNITTNVTQQFVSDKSDFDLNLTFKHEKGNESIHFNFHFDLAGCDKEKIKANLSTYKDAFGITSSLLDKLAIKV